MLRPLLLDVVPSIQQTAALALGRLADHSDDLAQAVVKEDILPQLVHSLTFQNVSIAHLFCSNRAKCFKMFQRWFGWWICMCVCVCLRERERKETLPAPGVSPLDGRMGFGLLGSPPRGYFKT